MMKALYARQSLDKKDSVSIESQIEACKKCILSTDKYEEYTDKGFSGKNTSRPALERLFNDVQAGKIDQVIVYRLDRFSRNVVDFYNMYETLKKYNCEFVSASEQFDTASPMGRAMMSILVVFAQMERESIQQRVKDNYYFRTADSGSWAGGPAPFGFSNGRTAERKATLTVNEEEMKIVKFIFWQYHYNPNISLGKIAKYLNDNELHSRRDNGRWDSSSISKILQTPVYVKADEVLHQYLKLRQIKFLNPEEEWNGTTSCHIVGKRPGNANIRKYADLKDQSVYLTNFPGIIESRIYVDIMNRLAQNEQIPNINRIGVLQELGGKLKCTCGYAIKAYSKSTTGRPFLDCYANRTLHACNHRFNHFNFYEIQKQVGSEIQTHLDEHLAKLHQKRQKRFREQLEIKTLQDNLAVLIQTADSSDLLGQALRTQIENAQREINERELKLVMSNDVFDITNLDLYNKKPSSEGYNYFSLSVEEKNFVVNQLIEKIVLDEDNDRIDIHWKI